jgi:hypothetical protein
VFSALSVFFFRFVGFFSSKKFSGRTKSPFAGFSLAIF